MTLYLDFFENYYDVRIPFSDRITLRHKTNRLNQIIKRK